MDQFLQPVGSFRSGRGRAAMVAETLAALHGTGERPEELAHDARNMVAALELYCSLLEEPGILAAGFRHYASELRLIASASRRLVEKLAVLDPCVSLDAPGAGRFADAAESFAAARDRSDWQRRLDPIPAEAIENMAAELGAKRNLMAALAGPAIALTVQIQGGALPVLLTREDFTRVLVNLVKNAIESTPPGGRIELGLDEFHAQSEGVPWLVLTVEDSGPGIPAAAMGRIFDAGFSLRTGSAAGCASGRVPGREAEIRTNTRRGLGLSIARSIVEAAGGRIFAANRPQGGARFEIELPVRKR